VIELAAIHVYPVKGCRGFAPRAWELDRLGLQLDRAFTVVDSAGRFVSQREEPRLARIETELSGDALELRSAGFGAQRVSLAAGGERVPVEVWKYRGEALDQGEGAACFLSEFLGRKLRLVRVAPDHERPVAEPGSAGPVHTAFSDGYPLLIVSEAALAELNRRLPSPISMARFRPNLVFAGAAPHAEDGWGIVRVGGVELELVKPCQRCEVTCVDPELGVRAGSEPLRTLARYRRLGSGVCFGVNAVHRGPGRLALGAALQLLSSQPPPAFEPER
jgi:uncharacterized protein YcbX